MTNLSSIWLWFRTGGPILGGAIVLGLNRYVKRIIILWVRYTDDEEVPEMPMLEEKLDQVSWLKLVTMETNHC